MSELKPCPFCGEPVYLDKIPMWSSYNGITHGYGGCYEFDVRCRNPKCGCSIKLFKNNTIYSNEEEARLNAIKTWNRRSTERKHGEWIPTNEVLYGAPIFKCSVCEMEISDVPISKEKPIFPYCPWCGADMRGADNDY